MFINRWLWLSICDPSLSHTDSSPGHRSAHLLTAEVARTAGSAGGCGAGGQRAAALTSSSSSSFSRKNRSTVLQLNRPDHPTTFAWGDIPSSETKCSCVWMCQGCIKKPTQIFPCVCAKAKHRTAPDWQTNRPGSVVYSKKSFCWSKEGLTNKLCRGWMMPIKLHWMLIWCRWNKSQGNPSFTGLILFHT